MKEYKDKYGIIWLRYSDFTVWSREFGWGLWDFGRGLTLLEK